MALVNDITLTTTLNEPVSLMQTQETGGYGKLIAEWLKPTFTIHTEYLGTHDVALWGKAEPLPKGTVIFWVGGLLLLFVLLVRRL